MNKKIIKRYHQGQCTPEERELVEQWLASGEYEEALHLPEGEKKKAHEALIWQNIQAKLPKSKTVPLHQKVLRYAAAVLLLSSLGLIGYYMAIDSGTAQEGTLAYFEEYRSVTTPRGEKRTVTLPDGSTVRMNYETELRIPDNFDGGKRLVYLTGHAHFDVFKNPDKPFIIYTKHSKTQVLGTSFDINTTKKTGETELIVTSGKVAFSEKTNQKNQVTLTVNNRALLQKETPISKSVVDAKSLTAWKDDRLVFDYVPFAEIIPVLEGWYDVTVTVEDPALLKEVFNFSYDNPSLETLMERLGRVFNFQYSIEGKRVIIHKNRP